MKRPSMRARVTFTWGAWMYRLQSGPEFIEYIHPIGFPTPHMAADAARRELAIRGETDPVKRALMRVGVLPVPTRPEFALAN
ncbi:hypothetical protein [Microlunatus parietis]|uniref:Uncharacterized protein n=1 Tax=Microlunatus parietis TaxID=682979 RepID=A0A7Y9L6K3_9ACTN|nr:hypothetical protein [Microlunatus parietis]NYE68879.1 hypothetical protein [Microlunatus parietis]